MAQKLTKGEKMKVNCIEDIINGVTAFMPSGLTAEISMDEQGNVIVKYQDETTDIYTQGEFGNIINDGIEVFEEPSQMILENAQNYILVKAQDFGDRIEVQEIQKGYNTFDDVQQAINDLETDHEFQEDPTLMLFVGYEKDGILYNATTGEEIGEMEDYEEPTFEDGSKPYYDDKIDRLNDLFQENKIEDMDKLAKLSKAAEKVEDRQEATFLLNSIGLGVDAKDKVKKFLKKMNKEMQKDESLERIKVESMEGGKYFIASYHNGKIGSAARGNTADEAIATLKKGLKRDYGIEETVNTEKLFAIDDQIADVENQLMKVRNKINKEAPNAPQQLFKDRDRLELQLKGLNQRRDKILDEKVEYTKNYKRTRLEAPSSCKPNSFRTKEVNKEGDKIVLCQDKKSGDWKAQSKLEKTHENKKGEIMDFKKLNEEIEKFLHEISDEIKGRALGKRIAQARKANKNFMNKYPDAPITISKEDPRADEWLKDSIDSMNKTRKARRLYGKVVYGDKHRPLIQNHTIGEEYTKFVINMFIDGNKENASDDNLIQTHFPTMKEAIAEVIRLSKTQPQAFVELVNIDDQVVLFDSDEVKAEEIDFEDAGIETEEDIINKDVKLEEAFSNILLESNYNHQSNNWELIKPILNTVIKNLQQLSYVNGREDQKIIGYSSNILHNLQYYVNDISQQSDKYITEYGTEKLDKLLNDIDKDLKNLKIKTNEAFDDEMSMLTDINDLDFPQALADTVDTTEEGEVLTLGKIADQIADLKDEIKDGLEDIKDEVKDVVTNVKKEIEDEPIELTDDELADIEDIEFEDAPEAIEEEPAEESEEEKIEDEQFEDGKEQEKIEESYHALGQKGNSLDELISNIEKNTDYDVLNYDEFNLDIIDRNGNDNKVDTIPVYNGTKSYDRDTLKLKGILPESLNEERDLKAVWAEEMKMQPIMEFPNGHVVYLEPDYDRNVIVYGGATNMGIIPEGEVEFDNTKSLDWHIQGIYDELLQDNFENEDLEENYKKYIKRGCLEDLAQTKREIDTMTQQGKSAKEIKDTITIKSDNEKEQKEAEDYAVSKLKEQLLNTSKTSKIQL